MSTLERALTRWLVIHRVGKTPATKRYYWQTVKQIRRAWSDRLTKPVADVDADDMATFALRAGYFCASRWNGMLTVLYATIPLAKELLKRRPVKLTRLPPPSPEEYARLVSEAEKLQRTHAALVIDFLGHTGLRISAARRVKWTDVHADRIEYVAKGGRLCAVPIINGLRGVLDRLRVIDDGSGYVLPRPMIRRALQTASKRAGLRPLSHHDFRHMFTTRCIESGVDLPTVARWRGDSDGGALLSKRYFHLLDSHSRAMAQRVQL